MTYLGRNHPPVHIIGLDFNLSSFCESMYLGLVEWILVLCICMQRSKWMLHSTRYANDTPTWC
jgi:hypothetical protein